MASSARGAVVVVVAMGLCACGSEGAAPPDRAETEIQRAHQEVERRAREAESARLAGRRRLEETKARYWAVLRAGVARDQEQALRDQTGRQAQAFLAGEPPSLPLAAQGGPAATAFAAAAAAPDAPSAPPPAAVQAFQRYRTRVAAYVQRLKQQQGTIDPQDPAFIEAVAQIKREEMGR